MASGVPRPSSIRIGDSTGDYSHIMLSTSVATTSTRIAPGTSTFSSNAATTPAGKASFQGSEFDRPWVRSALLSPSRCSSQFFDVGPSPFDSAGLDAPPRPPYARTFSDASSMSSRSYQFSLLPDPTTWGSATGTNEVEPDDELHTPDPTRDRTVDKGGTIWTSRGVSNLGCMFAMCIAIFGLFVGFPVAFHFTHKHLTQLANTNSTNSTGQVPDSLLRRFDFDDLSGR